MAKRRKKQSASRAVLAWAIPACLWLLFVWWYSNTSGPLSEPEVDAYIAIMEERGTGPERQDSLRRFLQNDTGDDFAMLNIIELNSVVPAIEGLPEGATAEDAMSAYMSHMWSALFTRACHPVMFGTAATDAVDVWGIDGAKTWSQGALVRYRSRRDMMDIATDPDFNGPHEFKVAGMNKTIAVPLDPWGYSGDPRLLLGLFALIFALVFGRR